MISHSYPSFDTLIFINQNQLCVFYVIKSKMQFYMKKKVIYLSLEGCSSNFPLNLEAAITA